MKKISIWTDGIKDVRMDSLKENIECDILVIGGGIAGLSTVYNLKDSGKKIVLIDKNKCGIAEVFCNTAFFCIKILYHSIFWLSSPVHLVFYTSLYWLTVFIDILYI